MQARVASKESDDFLDLQYKIYALALPFDLRSESGTCHVTTHLEVVATL